MEIQVTTRVFKRTGSKQKALKNLKEAVWPLLEESEKMGTRELILEEAGYSKRKHKLTSPKFIGVQRVSVPLPAPTHVKV